MSKEFRSRNYLVAKLTRLPMNTCIMERKGLKITGRVWITSNNETLIGLGRFELLSRIEEFGSISKAAKDMGMSYKKAWELVNSINNAFSKPIVVGIAGGTNGGGSTLSAAGKDLLRIYKEIELEKQLILQG